MDTMFPSQGEPPAEMLRDIPDPSKRAIKYVWFVVGDWGMEGVAARLYVEVIGTANPDRGEIQTSPLSYDILGVDTDNVFEESDDVDARNVMHAMLEKYGLQIDPSSWAMIEPGRVGRVAIIAPGPHSAA